MVVSVLVPLVLMFLILPVIVFPLLDVVPGGKQEVLGTLFQQTARYATDYSAEVTEEEKEAIDTILGYESLSSRYDPFNTDPVKFMYNYNASTKELVQYLTVWLQQGFKHPGSYLFASFSPIAPFFSNSKLAPLWDTADAGHGGSSLLHQPHSLEIFKEMMEVYYSFLADAPIVSVLFNCAFWVLFMPLMVVYLCFRREHSTGLLLLPLLGLLAFCLISPVASTRYIVPLVFTLPWIVLIVFFKNGIKDLKK